MPKIMIPTPLRKFTNNTAHIVVDGASIEEALHHLVQIYPELKNHLFNENTELRSYINIFLDDQNIKDLNKTKTLLQKNSVISLVPAIAGGNADLSQQEFIRYGRHIAIPEFNIEGQKKLKAAKILVVGAGGLGCPVLLYLTAAGVGTIGIVDYDMVDESNLQRQILFNTHDVGTSKVEAAQKRLLDLNPYIDVKTYSIKLTSQNALNIIKDYDVVIDGTDNFPTRYLVNDACVLLNKPNVHGSIFRFEGQVSVFNYTNASGVTGPNYRCLFPEPPPPGLVPNCAEGGVLGVLPGIIGTIQASEAIKIVTNLGEPLSGKLMIFDALTMQSRILNFKKDENNPLNGRNPTITKLIDYEQFCGLQKQEEKTMQELTVQELKIKLDNHENFQLIDVREELEYQIVNLGGTLIPLSSFETNIDQITKDIAKNLPVIIHCKSGGRSAQAVHLLQEKYGYTNVYNLKGGIMAYINEIDPTLPRY